MSIKDIQQMTPDLLCFVLARTVQRILPTKSNWEDY